MGPKSKEAILRALGHLVDELLQQREIGKQTLNEVRKLARRVELNEDDTEQLRLVLGEKSNGKGH